VAFTHSFEEVRMQRNPDLYKRTPVALEAEDRYNAIENIMIEGFTRD
jgi:hypothetical protein